MSKKGSEEERALAETKKDEIDGLLRDGKFEPILESKIVGTPQIFESIFIDYLNKVWDRLNI